MKSKLLKKPGSYLSVVLIIVIFLIGFLARFYLLGNIPSGLYWDEVAMLADAKTLANFGHDLHGHSWLQSLFISYGDYKSPVFIWLATLSVKLFGATNFALRIVSALAGLASMLLSLLIVQELFPKVKNRLCLLLGTIFTIALSPWAIMFSRTAFEGHLAQMLVSVAVLFLLKSKKKKWMLLLSIFCASLATYTYYSVRFVWPIILVVGLWLINKQKKKFEWGNFVLMAVGSGLIYSASLLPMLNSPFYQASNQFRFSANSVLNAKDWVVESNQLRQLAGNVLNSRFFYHRHWLLIRKFAQNLANNLSLNFLFVGGDSNLRHGTTQHGLFLFPFVIPFLVGLYVLAKKRFRELLFLVCWWLAALVPASVPLETPHALRSLNALMPLTLIIGFGSYQLLNLILVKQKKQVFLSKIFSLITIVLCLASFAGFSYHYFNVYPQDSAHNWQAGYEQLAKKVCAYQNKADKIWIQLTDQRFFLWPLAYC
ncbi:MAG: glycosyltransferase family 39 protein, partial [Patescibacteria group bacterium]|nr:glycosyltransferase family 39 protein [Patescibacteria group bacterium]